jgi:hypothetical protein
LAVFWHGGIPRFADIGQPEYSAKGAVRQKRLATRALGASLPALSYGPHHGEEDVLRGWRGSGTIFFTRCNLHCLYCQNHDISQTDDGDLLTPAELAAIMLRLQGAGCHNINLVSPSHVAPQILAAVLIAAQAGLRLPLVYNTGGYDDLATLALLDGVIDIYMPDMKYADPAAGLRYSQAPDYPGDQPGSCARDAPPGGRLAGGCPGVGRARSAGAPSGAAQLATWPAAARSPALPRGPDAAPGRGGLTQHLPQRHGPVPAVMDFIRENALALLGFVPEIFAVSARLALKAKEAESRRERDALWEVSRFQAVETYVLRTLDEKSRIRLKLRNPLGVGERLVAAYHQLVRERLETLASDMGAIDNIEAQLEIYRSDMHQDFRYRLADIEKVLLAMNNRGMAYFDDTLRLARVLDLVNTQRIQGEFERQVVADTPIEIEREVNALIDWLVEKDLRQWQATLAYLDRHRAQVEQRAAERGSRDDKIIGQVGGPFEYNRRALLDSVGRAAKEVVISYDREAEARELASGVRDAVAGVAVVEVGAVGLGALLVAILHGALLDFTGILGAGALAVVGLLIIPAKRRQAKNNLRHKLDDLQARLTAAMSQQFERELERSIQRLREAVAPYTRFVRAERQKLQAIEAETAEIAGELARIRARIEDL